MGKVFTWEEIQAKRVPAMANFVTVVEKLRVILTHESSILAAGICGSVTRGDHSRRSDIDCIVIFDAAQNRKAYAVMQELSLFAHNRYVPLTFIQSDTRLGATRMHHFGPSFVEHVAFSMRDGGLIKGQPLDMLAPSVTRAAGIEEYLRFKMHYLQSHWAHYPASNITDQAQFLQKSLEAPLHVARKVLSWKGPITGDSKRQVLQQYCALMPAHLGSSLADFVDIDRSYTVELETQLEDPRAADYDAMLDILKEQVPDVLDFVTENLEFISKAP